MKTKGSHIRMTEKSVLETDANASTSEKVKDTLV